MSPTSVILLVEDNEDDVFFMRRALRDAQFSHAMHVVTDGRQAIDYLDGKNEFSDRTKYPKPALIFLDLKLPLMDGFEVLAWIRQRDSNLPVAVLSSSPEEVDMRRARDLGASCYLLKPPSVAMLKDCFNRFDL